MGQDAITKLLIIMNVIGIGGIGGVRETRKIWRRERWGIEWIILRAERLLQDTM